MTELVTVRRDTLLGLLDAAIRPPWREDDENTHKQRLEKALADMAVSPWREIDDEARNGEPWLVATKMEPPGKLRRQIARYIPRYTEQNDEDFAERCEENDEYYTPEGWYEMCYEHDEYIAMGMKEAPSLYAPIPEQPK